MAGSIVAPPAAGYAMGAFDPQFGSTAHTVMNDDDVDDNVYVDHDNVAADGAASDNDSAAAPAPASPPDPTGWDDPYYQYNHDPNNN
jgi:hypothetical protein